MYVCLYVCMYMYMCVCVSLFLSLSLSLSVYGMHYMHALTNARTHARTYAHMRTQSLLRSRLTAHNRHLSALNRWHKQKLKDTPTPRTPRRTASSTHLFSLIPTFFQT